MEGRDRSLSLRNWKFCKMLAEEAREVRENLSRWI
ncbi:hypothetical protein V6Z11_D03G160300 [Gossypium hirsutum]